MIIVLANTKGGVGKSTLAVHIALWLHDHGLSTAFLDADKQLSGAQWIEEAEPAIPLRTARNPDDCLDACERLQREVACVICDGPAGLDDVSRSLMLMANLALMPISPSILDLRSVTEATSILRYAQRIQGDRLQGALVLNKMRRRERISRELARAVPQLGIGVASSVIRDLQAFRDAAQQGTVVTRMNTRSASAAASDLHAFCDELFGDWLRDLGILKNEREAMGS